MADQTLYYPISLPHAARVSIANGASVATFTAAALAGLPLAGGRIVILPDAAALYDAGLIADPTAEDGEYENLELPLVTPWNGTAITNAKFVIVYGAGAHDNVAVMSAVTRFRNQLQNGAGLTYENGNIADDSLVTNGSVVLDWARFVIQQKRAGTLEDFPIGHLGQSKGRWDGNDPKHALAISTGNVAIDFDDGPDFELELDDDAELQLPTNVTEGDTFDILFIGGGAGNIPTYASGFEGVEATEIRTGSGERSRLIFSVDAQTGGTATSVTVSKAVFADTNVVEDGTYTYRSNFDDNWLEPPVGETSNTAWTYVKAGTQGTQGEEGEPGSAVVTGTSTTSLAIQTGSRIFTIVETSPARGWAVGARLRAASAANPTTHWMEGEIAAFDGTTLELSIDLIGTAATRADWDIGITGEPGTQGNTGDQGDPAFLYVGYASADDGSDFSLTPGPTLDYVAFLVSETEIETPEASDFTGLWKLYRGPKGDDGDTGEQGDPGASGGEWFSGATDPDNGNGADGDFYLQTGTGATGELGDVWKKAAGTWSIVTNIKGADGAGAGSVTSIQVAVPTGLTSSGGPITTSGTITLAYDTGYQGYTTTEASKLSGIASGANVNVYASATELLTGTESAKSATPDSVAAIWEKGSDIASAATISIGEGGLFHVTGTTTITDIDWATAKDGRGSWLIFDDILTFTHHATTLKLPTGSNITTAAGDRCYVVQDSSDNAVVLVYQRADGTPLAGGGGTSPVGVHEVWIPASAMTPRGTNGAALTDYISASTRWKFPVLAFDATTQEYASFPVPLPKSWNAGTVTFIPHWTNAGGSSTQTVAWALIGAAVSNDDSLDPPFGTSQSSSDTWIAQNDLHIGPESSAITIGGSPAKTDCLLFSISRDVSNDNMSGDALLIGIMLRFTTDAATDA